MLRVIGGADMDDAEIADNETAPAKMQHCTAARQSTAHTVQSFPIV